MERIPFDIKFRPEIEARQLLVETKDGKSVRIVCWDKRGHYPIVALVQDEEAEFARVYTEKGEYDLIERRNLDLCLVPNPDHNESPAKPSVTAEPSVDWYAFRREAAKDFVGAILSNSALVDDHSWDYRVNVIGTGVAYADELIEQLKEGKK